MLEPGFYNMDCMEGMAGFPDGFFDLAIVDPPYGIRIASHKAGKVIGGGVPDPLEAGAEKRQIYGRAKSCKARPKPYHTFDDSRPPDEGYFKELARVSARRVIWGGNFMLDHLGAASCMLIWDKKRRGMDQADCEIAWTNLTGQSRIFEYVWNGMLQNNMREKETRIHPTQKPVALYTWILKHYAKPGDKILDTHVGSASSLIACRRGGFEYWGFEIDPTYYAEASARLARECAQVNLADFGL